MKDGSTNNYAFIDGNNLYLNIKKLGWKLNYIKFREYLSKEYAVTKAYIFLGYRFENRETYTLLEDAGYILIFKEATRRPDGSIKGNCDVDIVLHVCLQFYNFDKAVMVTDDGDFLALIQVLFHSNKLKILISSCKERCSYLYLQHIRDDVDFLATKEGALKIIDKNTV